MPVLQVDRSETSHPHHWDGVLWFAFCLMRNFNSSFKYRKQPSQHRLKHWWENNAIRGQKFMGSFIFLTARLTDVTKHIV